MPHATRCGSRSGLEDSRAHSPLREQPGACLAATLGRIIFAGGHHAGAPDEGVLEFVMVSSRKTILILTMRFDARQYTGVLSWDAPPSLAAVENLLGANLGAEIRAIGDLDIID